MTEKLPTGIDVLDRELDGGIPAGRVVALSAAPASQSELFLYEVASARETTYLTTERTAAAVREVLEGTASDPDDVEVYRIGPEDPIVEAAEAIGHLPDRSTLIVDPMRLLERQGTAAYRAFLNDLRRTTAETGSIAFLHCLDGETTPPQRDRTRYVADVVFDLATELRGDTIENRLSVPKLRGGRAIEDAIKLNLQADVSIDVSRKIA